MEISLDDLHGVAEFDERERVKGVTLGLFLLVLVCLIHFLICFQVKSC